MEMEMHIKFFRWLLVNAELGCRGREVVVAYFEVLFHYLAGVVR
jgi:hypothetical protein